MLNGPHRDLWELYREADERESRIEKSAAAWARFQEPTDEEIQRVLRERRAIKDASQGDRDNA